MRKGRSNSSMRATYLAALEEERPKPAERRKEKRSNPDQIGERPRLAVFGARGSLASLRMTGWRLALARRSYSRRNARLSNRNPSPFLNSKMTSELASRHRVRSRCNCPGLIVNETSRSFGVCSVTVASDVPPL